MQKITNQAELGIAIGSLEQCSAVEMTRLKEQFFVTYENLKLINIIKGTLGDAIKAPSLKNRLIDAAIGLTTGYVTKRSLIGNTHNPLKKLLGMAVEIAVAGKVSKNAGSIRAFGSLVYRKLFPGDNETRKA